MNGRAAGVILSTNLTPDQLRDALVRDIVAQIAPNELPVVAAYSRQRPSVVARRLRSRRRYRDPLAFGVEAGIGLLSPLVWLAVREAVRQIGADTGKSASNRLKSAIRRLARRKRGDQQASAAEAVVFSPRQLAAIHAAAAESAQRHRVAPQRANTLADSVVAILAIANENPNPNAPAIAASGGSGAGETSGTGL